jgi:hypothetical protein
MVDRNLYHVPYENQELTIAEIAACFAPELSIGAVRRIIRNGKLKTRKVGRVRYANIGDIEYYLDQRGYGCSYPPNKPGELDDWGAYAVWQRAKQRKEGQGEL